MLVKTVVGGVWLSLVVSTGILSIPAVALAQTPGPSAEEEAAYSQGLAAAKAGQYADAIKNFTNVYMKDPNRSEVWLYLGLAQARTPGHEIRAIAWLQAYILANPNAPNIRAVQAQIALLEDSVAAQYGQVLDELENAIPSGTIGDAAPNANDLEVAYAGLDAESIGNHIGGARAFLGDTQSAVRILNRTNGRHWANNRSGKVEFGWFTRPAFFSAPSLPVTAEIPRQTNGDQPIQLDNEFMLETATPANAYTEVESHWNTQVGWYALACTERERGDNSVLPPALDQYWAAVQKNYASHPNNPAGERDSSLVEAVGYLVFFGRNGEAQVLSKQISREDYKKDAADYVSGSRHTVACEDASLWWSSGRTAFLTGIGTSGGGTYANNESPYLDHEVFSADYDKLKAALVSPRISVRMGAIDGVADEIANMTEVYRKVRGPYAPALATWPNELFAKGVALESHQQWVPALQYLTQSMQGDPTRTETLLHLGLVSAQIPGREHRAVAFLKAYIALSPNSGRRAEAEGVISRLMQTIQSNLEKDLDELEHTIRSDKNNKHCSQFTMADREALAGFSDRALQTLKMKSSNKNCRSNWVDPQTITSLAVGGNVEAARQALALYPPSWDNPADNVFTGGWEAGHYDDLVGAFVQAGALKDAETLFSAEMKHSLLAAHNLPLLACREYRAGNVAYVSTMLNDLRDIAVAGATVTQQDQLADYLGKIARLQVLIGDTKDAEATLDHIKYPDKRKVQSEGAISPKPVYLFRLESIFWAMGGPYSYPFAFGELHADECWFPQTRVDHLIETAVGGFFVYAKDSGGDGKCLDTTIPACIEKAKQAPKSPLDDDTWDHWDDSVGALVKAYAYLRAE